MKNSAHELLACRNNWLMILFTEMRYTEEGKALYRKSRDFFFYALHVKILVVISIFQLQMKKTGIKLPRFLFFTVWKITMNLLTYQSRP